MFTYGVFTFVYIFIWARAYWIVSSSVKTIVAMSKTVSHESKWRSQDVSLSSFLDSENVEIVSPNPVGNKFTLDYKEAQSLTFSSIKINSKIVEELSRCGFSSPSPIQAAAIPFGRIGVDLIAQSKSGTGKTLVFVISLLEMIVPSLDELHCPKALILAPTREIALQIADLIDSLTSHWNKFECFKAIGGTKVSDNLSSLPVSHVIVGTPGRILSLLELNLLKASTIRFLVLDECDKLMEKNFKTQIDNIYSLLPENKQIIVTSATMSDEMTMFLRNYMNSPALVRLDADNPSLVGVMQMFALIEGHSLQYPNFECKIDPLADILRNVSFSQCLIFSNYQMRAKYLNEKLTNMGWTVVQISGDMSQKERFQCIDSFRKKKYKILISTDLIARGIDIDSVNLVINVDVPLDIETYLHRIGRAGRFGSAGIAITIVSHEYDYAKFQQMVKSYHLRTIELKLPIDADPWKMFSQHDSKPTSTNVLARFKQGMKMNPAFQRMSDSDFEVPLEEVEQSTEFDCIKENIFENILFEVQRITRDQNEQVSEIHEDPVEFDIQSNAEDSSDYESDLNSLDDFVSLEIYPENQTRPSNLNQDFTNTFLQAPSDLNSLTFSTSKLNMVKYLLRGGRPV